MNLLSQFAVTSLAIAIACISLLGSAFGQDAPRCISPAESVKPRGAAPGMKVELISDDSGPWPRPKQYAVIFSEGDEAYSGLLEFAQKYHVTSGHFTAIGALSRAVLAWFDPQKKLYCENPMNEQVEVGSMIGDFATYQESLRFTRTWLWDIETAQPAPDTSSKRLCLRLWRCS